ncbi:hypothetical protein [Pseudomonas putida]|jgi:hypothetical protein|uniref:HEPN domain-containing protein n=1 Tax=Pseudomonas putida (strain W619) TaxID=390235 RepID=B1J8Q1_PSEPW|nr:hypothetical protein [Pseudomonas putida]QQE81637.1 hypothetical protein JET17_13310 [Pseudomonas putida]
MQQHLTPWMIESAYRYWEAAKHLLTGHDMMAAAQVNAAIGMEILLKSFVAVPNGNHDQVNETYDLDAELLKDAHRELQRVGKIAADKRVDKHDLLTLFHAVPADIRAHLRFDQEEEWIERYRNVFTNARYPYEASSRKGYSDTLIRVLGTMIDSVVKWYREQGCRDVFIVCYGMTPADFQAKTGKEPDPS